MSNMDGATFKATVALSTYDAPSSRGLKLEIKAHGVAKS
jgi:hypothetical protein